MNIQVFAAVVVLHVVTVAYVERPIGIHIVQVVAPVLTRKRIGVVGRPVPFHALDAHGGMADVEGFILVILVSGIENQLSVVRPLQPPVVHEVGFHVPARIVFPAVLRHHEAQLLVMVGHRGRSVVHTHGYLLVRAVHVHVGIGRCLKPDPHQRLRNHELHGQHRGVSIILVIHRESVVAAHFQSAPLVRNAEGVVCVLYDGVYRVEVVLYRVVVEALQVVALEQFLRLCPVVFAVFHGIYEPPESV